MWIIVVAAGVAALVLSKSKAAEAEVSLGIRVLPNCHIEVVDDGPFIDAMFSLAAEMPGATAEQVLVDLFRRIAPRCSWPPNAGWRGKEGFRAFTWPQLVRSWHVKLSERGG
jgi:hypothetical protein